MKRLLVFAVIVVACFLALPGEALAWGPGVHLAAGNFILANADLLPPVLARLLPAWRDAYLYGALSADIFVGKGSRLSPGHSHGWETGLSMLRAARGPELEAYAYGYLSHLAADVVAHNFYVPNTMARALPVGGRLPHVFVEMQADRRVGWSRGHAGRLLAGGHCPADDMLLVSTGKSKSLFRLGKRVFRAGVEMTDRRALERLLSSADRVLRGASGGDYFPRMFDVSLRLVMDTLHSPEDCLALGYDPTGGGNLRQVGRMRREEIMAGRRPRPCRRVFPLADDLAGLPSLESWESGSGRAGLPVHEI